MMPDYLEAFAAAFLDVLRHARGSAFSVRPIKLLRRARELGYRVDVNPTYASVMRHYIEVLGKVYPYEVWYGSRGRLYIFERGDFKGLESLTPGQFARILKAIEEGASGPLNLNNALGRYFKLVGPPIMVSQPHLLNY